VAQQAAQRNVGYCRRRIWQVCGQRVVKPEVACVHEAQNGQGSRQFRYRRDREKAILLQRRPARVVAQRRNMGRTAIACQRNHKPRQLRGGYHVVHRPPYSVRNHNTSFLAACQLLPYVL
jgi:hypothetical protein